MPRLRNKPPRGWYIWTEETPEKNWRVRWRGKYGNGQKVFIFKSDADTFAENEKRNFQRRDVGMAPIIERARVPVSEWAKKYLETRAGNPRKNTYRNDCDAINQFRDWVIEERGDIDIGELKEEDVYLWVDWLYSEHEYAPATVRNRLAHLKPAVKWAKRRGMITINFAYDIDMPKPTARGRVLTEDEIKNHVYVIPPRDVVLAFALLLSSGMRKGELLSLLKSQVERREAPELWRVHFQGHQTKTGKPKSVVLRQSARIVIEEAMAASKSERVFENLTKDILDYWIRRIQDAIGPVRIHDFKHTFCTRWMESTGDLHGLQQMTGNSLGSLRIYTHLALGTPRGIDNFKGIPDVNSPSIPLFTGVQ